MRQRKAAPLLLLLLLLLRGAAAEDLLDSGDLEEFCGEAGEPGSGASQPGAWEWLPEAAPGLPDLPPEVLNATLAAFEEEYLAPAVPVEPPLAIPGLDSSAGAGAEGEGGGWVPCAAEDLAVDLDGCQQEGAAGEWLFWLRLNLTCLHGEHNDSASFDAWVELLPDGGMQVNISAVVLEVDESHGPEARQPVPCADPNCVVCAPGAAPLPGSPPLPEACQQCVSGFAISGTTGLCERVPQHRPGMTGSTADFEPGHHAPPVPSPSPSPPPPPPPPLEEPEGEKGEPGEEPPPSQPEQPEPVQPEPQPEQPSTPEQVPPNDVCNWAAVVQPEQPAGDPGLVAVDTTAVGPVIQEACTQPSGGCYRIPAQPENPAKACGVGFFVFQPLLALCTECDRPGCIDCRRCDPGNLGCVGSQYCVAPCKPGYSYHEGGCQKCGHVIPGCGLCRQCQDGTDCHKSMQCICCDEGLRFTTDGTRKCVNADGSAPAKAELDPYTPPNFTPLEPPAAPAVPTDPYRDVCQVVPVPTKPTPEQNGLTVPPNMSYGPDQWTPEYLACQDSHPDSCYLAPTQPANPAKPCGRGYYMFNTRLRLCTVCTRPGCLDCASCVDGVTEGCLGGQYCLGPSATNQTPCEPGYAYSPGTCRACTEVLPNCGRCSKCTGDTGCYEGLRCECCAEGHYFDSPTTRNCIPLTIK